MSIVGNSSVKNAARVFACICLFILPALASDITPPTLNNFTFTPTSVNTTTNSATVTISAQVSDNLSGVAYINVFFNSASGNQGVGKSLNLVSGNNLNGTYEGQVVIPAFSESGSWAAEVESDDNVGNNLQLSATQLQALGFPAALQVDAGTSVALISSLNPSTYGQPVTFTATATSGSGITPTGSVNFNDGSTTLGSAILNSSGVGTFTTSTLAAGTHSIVAAYLGDANNPAASSAALSQIITKAATTTALHSGPNPSTAGSEVTFNAAVASAGETVPGGIVTFNDGPTLLCRRNLVNSHAVCRTEKLIAGTHHVTARYLGDENSESSKASVQQVVH